MTRPVPVPRRDPTKIVVYWDPDTGHWSTSVYACWVIEYGTWRDAMDYAVGGASRMSRAAVSGSGSLGSGVASTSARHAANTAVT